MTRSFGLVVVLAVGMLAGYAISRGAPAPTRQWQFPRASYDRCLAEARGRFATLRTVGPPEGKALLMLATNADCARLSGIDAIGASDIRRYTGLKCCLTYLQGYDHGAPTRRRPSAAAGSPGRGSPRPR